MAEPVKCKCGAEARIRNRKPYLWIECKKKCGMCSGYIVYDETIPESVQASEQFAIELWNRMVSQSK